MLILSRHEGEEIVIGDSSVRIVVVEILPDLVRLQIESVHRKGSFDAIRLRPDDIKRGIGGSGDRAIGR